MRKIGLLLPVIAFCAFSSRAWAEIDNPVTRWRFKTEGAIRADAVVDGQRIFLTSTDGQVHALRKTDGKHLWTYRAEGALAGEPAVSGDTVVFTSRDDHVYALNSETGKEKWKFQMQPEDEASKSGWKYFTAAPVIAHGRVYVGSGDSNLYALDLARGKQIWKFATNGQIRATPVVDGNTIYQPSNDGMVYVVNTDDGSLLWAFETQGVKYNPEDFGFDRKSIYATPILVNGTLIIGSRDGNVYAIDTTTKTARWTFSYDTTWAMTTAADDNTIYVGWSTNDKFSAIDLKTGKEKWQFTTGSHNYTTALINHDSIYFGSADGMLYRLDKKTGKKAWDHPIGDEIHSSPVYDKETNSILVGNDDGFLHAVSQATPARKAVYQPSVIEGPMQYLIVDPKVTPHLVDAGFEQLDSQDKLRQFMQDRLADNEPSVIVFALPSVPGDIMGKDPVTGLLRDYLEAGGKVVWFGDPPNYYALNDTGDNFVRDAAPAIQLLGVSYTNLSESGNYQSRATQEGKNWGLPDWFKTTATPILPKGVTPLAHDEFGRVSAWVKRFHSRPGSGFVSLRTWGWNVPIKDSDLELIHEVATYGLK